MIKRKSKLIQTLYAIEDLLFIFDDYFSKDRRKCPDIDDFLNIGNRPTSNYFIKKGVLNPDLTFKEKPRTILKLIKEPWDNYWRFVIFDIPTEHNTDRDLIRRRLKEWGFKYFQRSVWFSPMKLTKWVKELDKQIGDTDYLTVIKGKIYRIDPKKIVKEKWRVSDWQKQAKNWISIVNKNMSLSEKSQAEFWELINQHPKVPLNLLPHNWLLDKTFDTFCKYKFEN